MKATIILTAYYIILLGYFLTGVILKDARTITITASLGIIGGFIAHWARDRPEAT